MTSDGQLKQSVNSDEKGKTATENDRKKEWWHTDDGNDKGNLQLHEGGYFDIELIIGWLNFYEFDSTWILLIYEFDSIYFLKFNVDIF